MNNYYWLFLIMIVKADLDGMDKTTSEATTQKPLVKRNEPKKNPRKIAKKAIRAMVKIVRCKTVTKEKKKHPLVPASNEVQKYICNAHGIDKTTSEATRKKPLIKSSGPKKAPGKIAKKVTRTIVKKIQCKAIKKEENKHALVSINNEIQKTIGNDRRKNIDWEKYKNVLSQWFMYSEKFPEYITLLKEWLEKKLIHFDALDQKNIEGFLAYTVNFQEDENRNIKAILFVYPSPFWMCAPKITLCSVWKEMYAIGHVNDTSFSMFQLKRLDIGKDLPKCFCDDGKRIFGTYDQKNFFLWKLENGSEQKNNIEFNAGIFLEQCKTFY